MIILLEAMGSGAVSQDLPALGRPETRGLVRMQAIQNANSLEGAQTNSYRVFDLKHSGFMLNQAELVLRSEKEYYTDERKIGYRFDIVGGRTAQASMYFPGNAAIGADGRLVSGSAGLYARPKVMLQQAHLTYSVRVPKRLDIRIGRMVTWQGFETTPDVDNINWLPSQTFLSGLGLPTTHTAVRVAYHSSERLIFGFAGSQGWDTLKDNNSKWGVMGKLIWNPTDRFNFFASVTHGPEQDTNNIHDRTVWQWNAVYNLDDKTTAAVDYANGKEKHPSAAPSRGGTVGWSGYVFWLKRSLDERTEAVLRYERFKDPEGYRTSTGIPGAGVRELVMQAVTVGFSRAVGTRWTLRGEMRRDWAGKRSVFTDAATPGGFSNDQTTALIDLIFRF